MTRREAADVIERFLAEKSSNPQEWTDPRKFHNKMHESGSTGNAATT